MEYDKKSICIVSAQYYPHMGGVEQYVDNFSKELIARGHNVTILTSEMTGALSYEKKDNLEIYRLPSLQLMNGRFPVLKKNKEVTKITKELLQKKFDVMLVNMRFYFISLYAVHLAKKMNIRCIMLDHGCSHLNTGGKLTSKLGEIFEHGITYMEKLYGIEYAGVSKLTLEWLEHFHIHSNLVLYNAIDVEHFESMKSNPVRDFRKEYGISKDAIIIAFVGRLTIEKGIRELVQAMNEIFQTRKDIYLIVAGEGYLREEVEKIGNQNIFLTGMLSTQEVTDLLQTSDILCVPSVSEGFSRVALEAMMCKNFVITTYRVGAREIITDKNYGIILKNNHSQTLAQAILSVVDNKSYRQQVTERCYSRVVNNYTWKHTIDRFLEIL